MRIGIYGGSFDPVHQGHLLVAQAAMEELQLDRLYWIPAHQSPFKLNGTSAPSNVRLQMLRLACSGQPGWVVDDQELRRGGVSYSIDTVQNLQSRHDPTETFWLIGSDHVDQLPKWKQADELARHVIFVVLPRPGKTAPQTAPKGFQLQTLAGHPIGLSSSEIRERVRAGQSIRYLVPDAVEQVILDQKLYL